ncbi:MAG: hypothetical protein AMK72_00790 [Planctomycetes bacterium SM23_25]|nr:MAG: hypothetical protein AMK72_00790 [Planctomycetes bacterium SM23_25]
MTRKVVTAAAVLAAVALAAGCIETKQDHTLNPDGSGKVLVEMVIPQMPLGLGPPDGQGDGDLMAKQFVRQILDGSKGVDAWSDVRYETTQDGRTKFIGTAYFKDFAQAKLQAGQMEGISFTKDDKGGMVLLVKEQENAEPATPPKELPEEQMAQRIQAERAQYQQMRPMVAATLGTMKMDVSFRLPGTLAEVNGFKKEPGGAVRLTFDGAQMLKALDELMADDAYVRQNVLAGEKGAGGPQMDPPTREKLFGTKGPLRARVTGPFKPLFPYESEAAAARAAYPAMIERLGLNNLPAPPPTPTLPPGFGLPEGRKGIGG